MKTYLIRSIKYLIWLALLFTLIFVLMIRTNTARRSVYVKRRLLCICID